jgi:predicted RecB family endonuclease
MKNSQSDVQITMSVDDLKALVQEAVRDALLDILGEDFRSEPEFAPEIAERLRKYQQERPASMSVDDVVKELELDA